MNSFPRLLLVATAITVLLSVPLEAVDPRQAWRETLAETSSLLKSGEHARALRLLKRVTDEMVERLGPGEAAAHLFGIVITQRAIAEAGLGHSEEAIWYWQVALSLLPSLAESDLSAFGEPAAFLEAHGVRADERARLAELIPGVTPPRIKASRKPAFPKGAKHFGVEGVLVVEVVITKEGKITAPRIIKPLPAPTLSYVALEAVRQWTVEPARVGKTPIDVLFELGVNYKLD